MELALSAHLPGVEAPEEITRKPWTPELGDLWRSRKLQRSLTDPLTHLGSTPILRRHTHLRDAKRLRGTSSPPLPIMPSLLDE